MIITLFGVATEKLEQSVVVEVGGIGYHLWLPGSDLDGIGLGQEARFWVYESIKEDAHELYGFTDYKQRSLFVKLLGVSGVGPKAAMAILSVGSLGNLTQAIATGDSALLESAPGIGKRTAERIIVELKSDIVATGVEVAIGSNDSALEALESLGYTRAQAAQALSKVSPELNEKERIRQALKEVA